MCTNPLVRFRLKYEPKVYYPFLKPEKFDKSSKGFLINSKRGIEEFFDSHGQYLAFMDAYCDYMELPCGHCIECRKAYARDWAVRCYHESLYHDKSCFITLTIADFKTEKFDERLAKSYRNGTNFICRDCVNGSRHFRYPINYSLNKGFILHFIKRLRDYLYRNYKINVRYFGCGEYGSDEYSERPHYHLILYGYDFPDVYINKKLKYRTFKDQFSKKGVQMFISEELNSLWDYGNAYIEELNMSACKYVAQYCIKKIKNSYEDEWYEHYFGRVPEFLFMSRGNCQVNRCKHIEEILSLNVNSLRNFTIPYCCSCDKTRGGLGYQWICDHMNEVKSLGFIRIEGKKYPIPEYYKKLILLTNPEVFDLIRSDNIYYVDEQKLKHPDKNSSETNKRRSVINASKLNLYGNRDCS